MAFAVPSLARAQGPQDAAAGESLWARDTLGGDWGGLRHALGQVGTRFDLWATGFHQGLFAGTGDDDWGTGGRVDLMIDSDTGPLGLWHGGGLHAHLTYRDGDLPGRRGGALWPVHTSGSFPLGSQGEVVATSLHVSQRFGDSTRLLLGKINAIDLLARHPFLGGWGTDRFWNVAFVAPPSGVVPPVIMGGILTTSSAPYTLTAMVFAPTDQTTSDSFNGLFEDGVNVSFGLPCAGPIAGRRSGTGITAPYSTAEPAELPQVRLPPTLQTTRKKGSYNVTVQVSHLLVESTQLRGQGLGLYAQAAVADGNPNPIRRSFVGGVFGHAVVPGRPLDHFGIGTFFYDFSDELQGALAPVGSFKDEQGVEAYYVFALTPWLRLSASLQWVDPATGANRSLWVGGLRARVAF